MDFPHIRHSIIILLQSEGCASLHVLVPWCEVFRGTWEGMGSCGFLFRGKRKYGRPARVYKTNHLSALVCCIRPAVCSWDKEQGRWSKSPIFIPSISPTVLQLNISRDLEKKISPQCIALPVVLRCAWKILPMWSNCVNKVVLQHFCHIGKISKMFQEVKLLQEV